MRELALADLQRSLTNTRDDAFRYHGDLLLLMHIAKQGTDTMDTQPVIVGIENATPDNAAFLVEVAKLAHEENVAGCPKFMGLGLVALWAGLEDAVNSMLVAWLKFVPTAMLMGIKELKNLKIPLAEFVALDVDERPEELLRLIQQKRGSALQAGLGTFHSVLDELNLKFEVDPQHRKALLHLHGLRNCIVHAKGIADRRFVKACPDLKYEIGDKLRIKVGDFLDYDKAVDHYLDMLWKHLDTKAQELAPSVPTSA